MSNNNYMMNNDELENDDDLKFNINLDRQSTRSGGVTDDQASLRFGSEVSGISNNK